MQRNPACHPVGYIAQWLERLTADQQGPLRTCDRALVPAKLYHPNLRTTHRRHPPRRRFWEIWLRSSGRPFGQSDRSRIALAPLVGRDATDGTHAQKWSLTSRRFSDDRERELAEKERDIAGQFRRAEGAARPKAIANLATMLRDRKIWVVCISWVRVGRNLYDPPECNLCVLDGNRIVRSVGLFLCMHIYIYVIYVMYVCLYVIYVINVYNVCIYEICLSNVIIYVHIVCICV